MFFHYDNRDVPSPGSCAEGRAFQKNFCCFHNEILHMPRRLLRRQDLHQQGQQRKEILLLTAGRLIWFGENWGRQIHRSDSSDNKNR